MYQYHGWMTTFEKADASAIEDELKRLNRDYPVSVANVNGELHIAFSGSPNRDCGELSNIIDFLCDLKIRLTGIVYINDPDSDRFDCFDCIKLVEGYPKLIKDSNFTHEETKSVFR